jgi:hypothetical protein
MATIGQRVFGNDGAKKFISLANEEFARTFKWGNNWTAIRLVFQCAIQPNLTSPFTLTGARLVSGVQYSTIAGRTYNSANTLNFVGIGHGHASETVGTNWNYLNNGGFTYYNETATQGLIIQRFDGVSSNAVLGGGNGVLSINATTGPQRRSIIGCDIWKPGATGGDATKYQARSINSTSTTGSTIDTNNFYLRDAASSQATVPTPLLLGASTVLTPIGSETGRPLDSAVIFWNQTFPMEIYGIYAVRFY